jgi:anti-sigma factor RsiW
MNCEQYQEYVSQFIDGELEEGRESELFHHLSTCASCQEFLKSTMQLRSELWKTQAVPLPGQLREKNPSFPVSDHAHVRSKSQRFAWMRHSRSISLLTAGFAVLLTIILSITCTTLWYQAHAVSNETVVFVPTLPSVEVHGHIPSSSTLQN